MLVASSVHPEGSAFGEVTCQIPPFATLIHPVAVHVVSPGAIIKAAGQSSGAPPPVRHIRAISLQETFCPTGIVLQVAIWAAEAPGRLPVAVDLWIYCGGYGVIAGGGGAGG